MKKAILALALVMSIGATQVSLASSVPKHRYHPTTQTGRFKGLHLHLPHSHLLLKDKDDEGVGGPDTIAVQIRLTMMISDRGIIGLFILDTV